MVKRRINNIENQFGTSQTAIFKNGKFINIDNGESISFKDCSFF